MEEEKPKHDPRGKATVSLILGFLSLVIPLITAIILSMTLPHAEGVEVHRVQGTFFGIFLLAFVPSVILGLVGLILGILGLKSTKKILAIIGIVLSIPVLLLFSWTVIMMWSLLQGLVFD
jgi:amino acid transporter